MYSDFYQTQFPFDETFERMEPQHQPSAGPPFVPPGHEHPFPAQQPPAGTMPQSGPPSRRPPSFVPGRPRRPEGGPQAYAVEPGAVRPCANRYIYLWMRNGQHFWAYLVFVGRRSVAGWRWTGFNWMYFGTDLRNIDNFVCY